MPNAFSSFAHVNGDGEPEALMQPLSVVYALVVRVVNSVWWLDKEGGLDRDGDVWLGLGPVF